MILDTGYLLLQVLKENGASKVYVMATHGILSNEAPKIIEEHIEFYRFIL
jgi:phosphoribosylpyrophosphate synthetase